MAELAVKNSDWIDCDPWEFIQNHYSTTLNVMKHFADSLPSSVKVVLLGGTDLLASMTDFNLWDKEEVDEILGSHRFGFLTVSRNEESLCPSELVFENDILHKCKDNILIAPQFIRNDISSTKIRYFTLFIHLHAIKFYLDYCLNDKCL